MSAERPIKTGKQGSLFGSIPTRPGASSEGGTVAAAREESQSRTASATQRALTVALMEEVVSRENLNRAYKRVKSNHGAAGIDGMSVKDLGPWLGQHGESLRAALLDGSYRPEPVLGVEIPKAGGGMRQLGIPTVVDRLVQQAILQVLTPLAVCASEAEETCLFDQSFPAKPGSP